MEADKIMDTAITTNTTLFVSNCRTQILFKFKIDLFYVSYTKHVERRSRERHSEGVCLPKADRRALASKWPPSRDRYQLSFLHQAVSV